MAVTLTARFIMPILTSHHFENMCGYLLTTKLLCQQYSILAFVFWVYIPSLLPSFNILINKPIFLNTEYKTVNVISQDD